MGDCTNDAVFFGGHFFVDGLCQRCGGVEPDAQPGYATSAERDDHLERVWEAMAAIAPRCLGQYSELNVKPDRILEFARTLVIEWESYAARVQPEGANDE